MRKAGIAGRKMAPRGTSPTSDALIEALRLPAHFGLEPELRDQLSSRPGHQRCIEGAGELLLIVHEVPHAGRPEREALYFWKRYDGSWTQSGGPGIEELGGLLDRYTQVIDAHEERIEQIESAAAIFAILRHIGPISRSTRNLVMALEQTLAIDPDDRQIRAYRDRAREIERAADLLHADARMTFEFWSAERAEQHLESSEKLGKTVYRLNMLAGFFLPLLACGGLLGMNVTLPGFVERGFWFIFFGGMIVGAGLLYLANHGLGKGNDKGMRN
jgi:hypothetical protein